METVSRVRHYQNFLVRPAKAGDVEDFGPYEFSHTFRGMTCEEDGKVIIVAGVLHSSPLQAVSYLGDDARKSPKTIVKFAKAVTEIFDLYDAPIYAIADSDEKDAPKFLEYLGFEQYQDRVYRYEGGR